MVFYGVILCTYCIQWGLHFLLSESRAPDRNIYSHTAFIPHWAQPPVWDVVVHLLWETCRLAISFRFTGTHASGQQRSRKPWRPFTPMPAEKEEHINRSVGFSEHIVIFIRVTAVGCAGWCCRRTDTTTQQPVIQLRLRANNIVC